MASAVGMNLDEVNDLANRMEAAATDLQRIEKSLSTLVGQSTGTWKGADAQRFCSTWDQALRPALHKCWIRLFEAVESARKNAQEQSQASAAQASDSRMGDRRSSHLGIDFEGRLSYEERPGDIRRGKYGRDRDMLDLANAAYWDEEEGHFGTPPRGWSEVSSEELRRLGFDPDLLGEYGSPFSARVYRSIDGDYVVAYEGTDGDNLVDWSENALGAVGATPSDVRAVAVAVEMKRALAGTGASLEYTGHSAGGRQAILAAQATGGRAVTFNPAPLSPIQQAEAQKIAGEHKPEITNYVTATDPLKVLRIGASRPPGEYVMLHADLPPLDGSVVDVVKYGHNIEALQQGFDKMVRKEQEQY